MMFCVQYHFQQKEEFGKYKVESPYKIEDLSPAAKNEGSEVRTRADKRPTDLKSAALDHSAIPPTILFVCYITSLSRSTSKKPLFYAGEYVSCILLVDNTL
jgi:hypothetical protein